MRGGSELWLSSWENWGSSKEVSSSMSGGGVDSFMASSGESWCSGISFMVGLFGLVGRCRRVSKGSCVRSERSVHRFVTGRQYGLIQSCRAKAKGRSRDGQACSTQEGVVVMLEWLSLCHRTRGRRRSRKAEQESSGVCVRLLLQVQYK